jgi:hypothetical protein
VDFEFALWKAWSTWQQQQQQQQKQQHMGYSGRNGSDGGNEVISDLFAFANKEVQIRHNLWEGFSDS